MKEIEDKNKQRGILCSWIERINVVKAPILPKAIFSAISNKISMTFFFTESEKNNFKIHIQL